MLLLLYNVIMLYNVIILLADEYAGMSLEVQLSVCFSWNGRMLGCHGVYVTTI